MGLSAQGAGSRADDSVLLAVVVVSLLSIDGTLIHQSVVVTLDGVFNDGREGDGLICSLAVMLDLRDQFHRLLTEADAELLRSIAMVVCHCCWGGSDDSGVGFRQHRQRYESAFGILYWDSGKRLEERISLDFLLLSTEIIALDQQDVVLSA